MAEGFLGTVFLKKRAQRGSWVRCERLPGLQGADGIDLGHVHNGAHGLQRRAAALPYLGGGGKEQ